MLPSGQTNRVRDASGFTLIEVLIVMVILGLLSAIAIPAFFNQRDKAKDADARTAARTAETAMETFAIDKDGAYSGAGPQDLVDIEATLKNVYAPPAVTQLAVVEPPAAGDAISGDDADNSYTVSMTSDTGNVFRIIRHNNGTTELTCDSAGDTGCPASGNWGG